ncbi:hypothetical protein [Streptomyces sp. NPDC020917]|uniref:Rv1733c family protein n=1 Tax=Streptomyces sp. NPDC020917 TaxID=3365102 RepID=UPI00378FE662
MGAFASRPARRRTTVRRLGWQWRRNPLRRRSDLAEAWLGLVTVLLLCLLPLLGWWAGRSVDRALQHVVRVQHAQRTLVTATVAPASSARSTETAAAADGPAVTAEQDARHGDVLVWTGPDHSKHTAMVPADLEVWHNDTVRLWTDRHGAIVPAPLDSPTAVTHAALAGVAAAAAAGGLLLMLRQILLWRLMLRRMDSWEREWARVGQDWGRTGAGG